MSAVKGVDCTPFQSWASEVTLCKYINTKLEIIESSTNECLYKQGQSQTNLYQGLFSKVK